MGRIKEWNEVFEKSIFAEDFFALISELYDKELEETAFVKRLYAEENDAGVYVRMPYKEAFEEAIGEDEQRGLYSMPEKMAGRIKSGRSEWYGEVEIEEGFKNPISYAPKALKEWERLFDAALGIKDFEDYRAEGVDLAQEMRRADTFTEGVEREEDYRFERGAADVLVKQGGIKLSGERLKRILDYNMKKDPEGRKHEIRVQMVNDKKETEDMDFDEMLEEMTTRLCAMMAKGTDGIYL